MTTPEIEEANNKVERELRLYQKSDRRRRGRVKNRTHDDPLPSQETAIRILEDI